MRPKELSQRKCRGHELENLQTGQRSRRTASLASPPANGNSDRERAVEGAGVECGMCITWQWKRERPQMDNHVWN